MLNFEQQMRRATKLAKNGSLVIVPRIKSESVEMLVKDPCYSANFFEDAPSGYWTTASDAATYSGFPESREYTKEDVREAITKALNSCEFKPICDPVDWPVEYLKPCPAEFDRTWGTLFKERFNEGMYGIPARMLKNEKEP